MDISYNGVNISKVDNVSTLVEMSASITSRAAAFNKRTAHYGLTGKLKEFNQSGKTEAEWDAIIGKAINELINKVKIEKLENAIKGLSEFLDEDTKLANKLQSIVADVSQPLN